MNGKRKILEITLKNGHVVVWDADKGEWDDYSYDGSAFIVKKDGDYVGIYNMDSVICAVAK